MTCTSAILLSVFLFGHGALSPRGAAPPTSATAVRTLCIPVRIDTHRIDHTREGSRVRIPGYGRLSKPGEPSLPARIFSIALPPGGEFLGINCETPEAVVLPGSYDIRPVQPPLRGREAPGESPQADRSGFADTYRAIYRSPEEYPRKSVELVGVSGFREYNLVDVRVMPFQYHPLSGRLRRQSLIRILISYREKNGQLTPDALPGSRTTRTAREIILNHEQAAAWYRSGTSDGSDHFDFVAIIHDGLTSSVAPLLDWERSKGRNVKLVTKSWIEAHAPGHDTAEKIRNFLRERYPSGRWDIEDVLLVGHPYDLPMRRTHPSGGHGSPETDFYYAELSSPDAESWDSDGNGLYGEDTDDIDFYAEVNVGRIPWSDPGIVRRICEKSAAYERNTDPTYKNNILLLASFVDDNTDGAEFMEYTVDPDIHPWMAQWEKTRLYEAHSTHEMDLPLNHANVISAWTSERFAVVSWHAHGSPTGSYVNGEAFISTADCPLLDDDHPAIISAASCSNSDTDYLNIGQAMMRQGAVGFLGANKSAWYGGGWRRPEDGSDQSFKYFFLSRVTSGEATQGEALQYAIREMYARGLWDRLKLETFLHGSLWGNPDLGLASPYTSQSPEIPGTVVGPGSGRILTEYGFDAVASDADLDPIYYCWSWGDGKVDWRGPLPSGTASHARHAWSRPGEFPVRVKVRDVHGAESGWSAPVIVSIRMDKGINGPRR